jgi:hypothetical protein
MGCVGGNAGYCGIVINRNAQRLRNAGYCGIVMICKAQRPGNFGKGQVTHSLSYYNYLKSLLPSSSCKLIKFCFSVGTRFPSNRYSIAFL